MMVFLSYRTNSIIDGCNTPYDGKHYFTPIMLIFIFLIIVAKLILQMIMKPYGNVNLLQNLINYSALYSEIALLAIIFFVFVGDLAFDRIIDSNPESFYILGNFN
jgi:hypothetical protein